MDKKLSGSKQQPKYGRGKNVYRSSNMSYFGTKLGTIEIFEIEKHVKNFKKKILSRRRLRTLRRKSYREGGWERAQSKP